MRKFIAVNALLVVLEVFLALMLLPLRLELNVWWCVPWIVGTLCLLIVWVETASLNKKIQKKGGVVWSSGLTALFKFYVPLTLLAGFIVDGLILAFQWWTEPRYITLVIVLPIGFLPILFSWEYRIKTLCVVGNTFFVSGFFKEAEFRSDEIVEFEKNYMLYYRIVVCRDGKQVEYRIFPSYQGQGRVSFFIQKSIPFEKFRKSLAGQIKGNRKRLLGG